MNGAERRQAILAVLCQERQETIHGLMERFHVCRSSIKRDIEILSCTYPIKTVRGKYGGGIFLEDWYRPERKYLSKEQTDLLQRLLPVLTGTDFKIMQSILLQFGSGCPL